MIKDLVNPTNFNLMVSKVGDVLVRALDKPLGYAINWGRVWSSVASPSGDSMLQCRIWSCLGPKI